MFDRICVDSLPKHSPSKAAVGSPDLRVAGALYARQTQTGGTQTHALFNTDFREVRANSAADAGLELFLGKEPIPWEPVGGGLVRVGSGVLKVREAFWDRLDGSIRTLTSRLESSDSREADILSSDLVS